MRASWRRSAIRTSLLVASLSVPGCCTVRPAAVGFLEGFGAISQSSAQKWQSEIESQCGGGPAPAEPSASSPTWWQRFFGDKAAR